MSISKKSLVGLVVFVLLMFGMFALPVQAIDFSGAIDIAVNQAVSGKTGNYDSINIYRFTLSDPSKVSFTFTHGNIESGHVYWKIELFDSNENSLFGEYESYGTQTTLSSINAYIPAGSYYVRIKTNGSYYWSDADYKITINSQKNNGEYEIESNDTFKTATLISTATNEITGNTRFYNDVDYYKFILLKDSKTTLTFTHSNKESSNVYWKIELFDSNENSIFGEYDSWGSATSITLDGAYLSKGTYYIRIKSNGSYYWDTEDYKIKLAHVENIGQFESEPNNSASEASPISQIGYGVSGNLCFSSDVDYFKFQTTAEADYYITFAHKNTENSNVYWKINLCDASENSLSSVDSRGPDTSIDSEPIRLGIGTYYAVIRSNGYYYYDNAEYTIKINSSNGGAVQSNGGGGQPPEISQPDPDPTEPPESIGNDTAIDGPSKETMNPFFEFSAVVTPVGVCFDWTPSDNDLGYRIYRFETPDGEGVNISDFPIKGSSYFDANVNPNTTYYYTIAPLIAEASFDIDTVTLTPEVLGESSEMITVVTGDIKELEEEEEEEGVRRGFIMMTIGNPYMIVNEDTMVEIDPPGRGTSPIVLNGRTMVPIRAIVESMGGVVDWNASTERITLEAQKHTVTMTLGSKAITVDGAQKEMDIAPYLNDKDRTLLPVRFVAENLGTQIEWIASLERVVIVYAMEATE